MKYADLAMPGLAAVGCGLLLGTIGGLASVPAMTMRGEPAWTAALDQRNALEMQANVAYAEAFARRNSRLPGYQPTEYLDPRYRDLGFRRGEAVELSRTAYSPQDWSHDSHAEEFASAAYDTGNAEHRMEDEYVPESPPVITVTRGSAAPGERVQHVELAVTGGDGSAEPGVASW